MNFKVTKFAAFCFILGVSWASEGSDSDDDLKDQVTHQEEQNARQLTLIDLLDERIRKLENRSSIIDDHFDDVAELKKKVAVQEGLIDKLNTPNSKTCNTIRQADPSKASGMYWIDPDGQGQGDAPIYVFCSMSTGTTLISHDFEQSTDVGHCKKPGCYSQAITYNATAKQVAALIQESTHCQQWIQYDCLGAPLQFNKVTYSWWNDRHGNPQNFWAGDNSTRHVCQCGIDEDCVDPDITCNCDSLEPHPLSDSGFITDKNLLPVSKVNFGRTHSKRSSGRFTLGKLECSGTLPFQGMPGSCEDLRRIGHQLSGIYSVQINNTLEPVYCDMTQLPGQAETTLLRTQDPKPSEDPKRALFHGIPSSCADLKKIGHQWSGLYNVKHLDKVKVVYCDMTKSEVEIRRNEQVLDSRPRIVQFHGTRKSPVSTTGVMSYNIVKQNVGEAMNLNTGVFTAPVSGIYFFSFNATWYSQSDGKVYLRRNDINIGHLQYGQNLTLTFKLDAGDRMTTYAQIQSAGYRGYSSYIGYDDDDDNSEYSGRPPRGIQPELIGVLLSQFQN